MVSWSSVSRCDRHSAILERGARGAEADFRKALAAHTSRPLKADTRPRTTSAPGWPSAQAAETARETRRATPDPKVAAQQVLDAGKRPFIKDNYEERMKALASALQNGDDTYRHALMKEILRRDPGATESWLTPGRADMLTRQGEISQLDRQHIATAMQDADVKRIKELLSDQGWGGFDRHEHAQEIVRLLTSGDSDRVNYILSQLSDGELKEVGATINHFGRFGSEGLNTAERKAFYGQLASKANAEQLVRFLTASSDTENELLLNEAATRCRPDKLISIMQGFARQAQADPDGRHSPMINATMLMAAVGNRASPQDQERFLAAVGQMPPFQAVARLDQFKAIWGNNQEKRFAIAAMLMQDPGMTPQRLTHAQDMAQLSNAVYGRNPIPSDYKPVNFNDPNLDPRLKGLRDEHFENKDSGFSAKLYYNAKTGDYALAFAGTDPKDINDDLTDILQGVGRPTGQYTQAIELALNLKSRLGPDLADMTGHSLGGGLAAAAAIATNTRATTFDAAGVHPNTLAPYGKTPADGAFLVTNYRVRNEVLTATQEHGPISGVAYDAVGRQVTIEVFDGNKNMLTGDEVHAFAGGALHGSEYFLRGMLVGVA